MGLRSVDERVRVRLGEDTRGKDSGNGGVWDEHYGRA